MTVKQVALTGLTAVGLVGIGCLLTVLVLVGRGPASSARTLNTVTVIQRVQELSQLVTVQYVLEKVVVYEDPKYFADLIPLGENRIMLLAHGQVKAGVDLSKLTSDDISISDRRITLRIPKAIVTDAYLVENQTRVLDWKTGLLRSFDKSLAEEARKRACLDIKDAARQGGIEEEATTRAMKQLGGFLQSLGFAEVEVKMRGK